MTSRVLRKRKLVVVGNGMAAGRMLEDLFARAPGAYDVTIFGAEPRVNYDRIMLSPVLSGEKAYEDIVMPKNSWHGFVLGVVAFVFGFAVIWHIWWLAGATFLGMIAVVVARGCADDLFMVIPAKEVARIEDARIRPALHGTVG